MFSKVALFVAASMAVFVAAAPMPNGDDGQCNTGKIQCCNDSHEANSAKGLALLSLIGVSAGDVTGRVSSTCSPITGIGAAKGASCKQQPMCCSNNNYNGLVVVGCTPINVL